MPKAVRFEEYGGVEVPHVVDVPRPEPGPGQALVRVKAAGINPGEAKIRAGLCPLARHLPVRAGQRPGRDRGAGRPRGDRFTAGDEVIGYTDDRGSAAVLAELAGLIDAGELEIPIAATFPLAKLRDAFRLLAGGHTRGKIVLMP